MIRFLKRMFNIMILMVFVLIIRFSAAKNSKNWMDQHMKNEHHIESYNYDDFFYLHGFSFNGYWVARDFRRIYGLDNENLSEDDKVQLETKLLYSFDKNNDGIITLDEFKTFINEGNSLPDLGFQGHHEDFETEFDIHYIQINHEKSEDDQLDWNHPEYIEHFRKHNELFLKKNVLLDEELSDLNVINDLNIIIIPKKYLRK